MTAAPSDPSGPTGQLATWVAALDLDSIPGCVVERRNTCSSTGSASR